MGGHWLPLENYYLQRGLLGAGPGPNFSGALPGMNEGTSSTSICGVAGACWGGCSTGLDLHTNTSHHLVVSGGEPGQGKSSRGPWVAIVYSPSQHLAAGLWATFCASLFLSSSEQLKLLSALAGYCTSLLPNQQCRLKQHIRVTYARGEASGQWGVCLSSESSAIRWCRVPGTTHRLSLSPWAAAPL